MRGVCHEFYWYLNPWINGSLSILNQNINGSLFSIESCTTKNVIKALRSKCCLPKSLWSLFLLSHKRWRFDQFLCKLWSICSGLSIQYWRKWMTKQSNFLFPVGRKKSTSFCHSRGRIGKHFESLNPCSWTVVSQALSLLFQRWKVFCVPCYSALLFRNKLQ